MTLTSRAGQRSAGIDIARGALLLAMLVVHVISGNATAAQDQAMHAWFGIFLVSSGFVALSGYVIGAKRAPVAQRDVVSAADAAAHLLLVMLGYGVLQSLARHGLTLAAGGAVACSARVGWRPPMRFDDLGIQLPIAIVQLFALLGRGRGRAAAWVTAAVAIAWMLLPPITARVPDHGVAGAIVGALTRRTLTPFYTVSLFVAVGLMGALLGRARWAFDAPSHASPLVAPIALALAIALAIPRVTQAVLDPLYRPLGELGGSVVTLCYWSVAIAALVRGLAVPVGAALGAPRRVLALLGRHSLLVFIAHNFLLEIDAFARERFPIPKGGATAAVMIAANLALLVALCRALERAPRARAVVDGLLLGRGRPAGSFRSRVLSLSGVLALAGVLAVYTGALLARADASLLVDDFEAGNDCPRWWTFGSLSFQREPSSDPGHGHHVLAVRGAAPGMFAHGCGLYMDRDVGARRTLVLDVRGYGPRSGRLKIELDEDDNGNWEIEKDPRSYVPLYDDRFVHELVVDWSGWRRLILPIAVFHDDNPHGGNNVFDPARDLTSGGLLEMQLLFSPTSTAGDDVRMDIDNVRWLP